MFGDLYNAEDLTNNTEILVKITDRLQLNLMEHNVLFIVNQDQNSSKYFPKIYMGGQFSLKREQYAFVAIQKLGKTLLHYFRQRGSPFSIFTVCRIGIKLISALQILHESGFVHNDLKPDNILVGDESSSPQSLGEIRLIDFGFATKISSTNKSGTFQGCLAYSSFNSMSYQATTEKDDLISLVYVLLHLHKGNLSFLGLNSKNNPQFQ
jgi:serine/threonine protein kinase